MDVLAVFVIQEISIMANSVFTQCYENFYEYKDSTREWKIVHNLTH